MHTHLPRTASRALLAAALAVALGGANAATLFIIADGGDALGVMSEALNSAVVTDGADAVLFKDSQVRRLTERDMARNLEEARRRGMPLYVCAADLERFGVPAAKVARFVTAIESKPDAPLPGEPRPALPKWPAVPFIKQMVKACENP